MTAPSPWAGPGASKPPQEPPRGPKWSRLLAFLGALAVLLIVLNLAISSDVARHGEGRDALIYKIVLLVAIGGSFILFSRRSLPKLIEMFGYWVLIIAAVTLTISQFTGGFGGPAARVQSALSPERPIATGGGVAVSKAMDGHFYVDAEVNGRRVRFVVDTGASEIVLSPFDAERLGFNLDELAFSRPFMTANGAVRAAPVRLSSVTVGPIAITDMRAYVNGADLTHSLLGMSFLDELSGYEVRGNQLLLRP